jgi:hypothetical protein
MDHHIHQLFAFGLELSFCHDRNPLFVMIRIQLVRYGASIVPRGEAVESMSA